MRASLIVALFLAVGCGGSTDVSIGDAGNTPSTPCGALALARCTKRSSCTSGTSVTRSYGDMGTCVTRETLACNDALAAPDTSETATLVGQCTAQAPSISCADFLDDNLPPTCAPVGVRATGAPCTFNAQCASGFCANERYATCGTCGPQPATGDSCATSNCGTSQECAWTAAVVNICEPFVASGGACGSNSAPGCAADLTCATASPLLPGVCHTAVGAVGAACGGSNMDLGCDGTRGLHCSDTNGTEACIAFSYAGDGMPCGTLPDGSFAECTAGTCYTADGPFTSSASPTGTCKAFAADGDACDTNDGPLCLSPARCVTNGTTVGVCTVPVAAVSAACK